MTIIADKNCVTLKDGTMYCWDSDNNCGYVLNKKKVGLRDIPEEALVQLLNMARGSNKVDEV